MAITLLLEALRYASVAFAALFPIINPLGAAPIFLSFTSTYPDETRTLLSRKIAIYGFLLLATSLTVGNAVLTFFGISLPIVQVAGGFVLANTGWSLLNQVSGPRTNNTGKGTAKDALEHAFYPLTLPLTIGPGCISVVVALGAHIRQQSTETRIDNFAPFLGALFGMALVCVTLAFCYQHAGRVASFLGSSGTNIVVRLSAFLLLALGVQIVWNGFVSLVTPLLVRAAP